MKLCKDCRHLFHDPEIAIRSTRFMKCKAKPKEAAE